MIALFDGIDRQTKEFSKQTGLKCKNGCGACCSTPAIETTVAEVFKIY
jgi:Fe-S-cluster containining protein